MLYQSIPVEVDYEKAGATRPGLQPTLLCYALSPSDELPALRKRPAVVLCPGGAYCFRSDREAEPVAMRYLAAGVHVFVLAYSVAPARYPCAALELAQAVRMIRQNADAWHVLPDQVYVSGFSAGGHLAASLGTLWDEPVFHQAFPEGASWRPDGMLLCYPVISLREFQHEGSCRALLGELADGPMRDALSLETRVTAKTPPAFLWHTADDGDVPVENSLRFAAALRRAGVSFELHIYEHGVHGLSLCDETTSASPGQIVPDAAGWMALALRWIKRRQAQG